MSKEVWQQVHDELVTAYMEDKGVDWTTAYERTMPLVQDAYAARMGDLIDHAKDLHEEGRL